MARSYSFRVMLVGTLTAMAVAGARPAQSDNVIAAFDFETPSPQVFFDHFGEAGFQERTDKGAHGGRWALECGVNGRGLTSIFKIRPATVAGTRLGLWYQDEYDSGLSPRAYLSVTVHSVTKRTSYTIQDLVASGGGWRYFEVPLTRLSPYLDGDTIDSFRIGLQGSAGSLHLLIDDVKLFDVSTIPSAYHPAPPPTATLRLNLDGVKNKLVTAAVTPWFAVRVHTDADMQNLGDLKPTAVLTDFTAGPSMVPLLKKSSSAAPLRFLVVPLILDEHTLLQGGGLRAAKFPDGMQDEVVCPNNSAYWQQELAPLLRSAFSLAVSMNLDGVLLDVKFDGTNHRRFDTDIPCVCQHCVERFVRLQGWSHLPDGWAKLPPLALLRSHRAVGAFCQWEQQQVRDDIHDALKTAGYSGTLPLGVIDYDAGWFSEAVREAVSQNGRPTVIATDPALYSDGYTYELDLLRERLRATKLPYILLPGLPLKSVAAGDLGWQAFDLAMNSNGMWTAAAAIPIVGPVRDALQFGWQQCLSWKTAPVH